jgi:hypothetical protein
VNCRKAKKLISPWLDGLPAGAPERDFLAHLDGCASCAEEAAQLKEILGVMHSQRELEEPPPWLAAGVMARLQGAPVRRGYALRTRALALAASLLFIFSVNTVVVRNYLVTRGGTAPEPVITTRPSDVPVAPMPAEEPVPVAEPREVPPPADPPAPAEVIPEPVTVARVPAQPEPAGSQEEPVPAKMPAPPPIVVASLDTVLIPEPELFLYQKRTAENVILRVAVPSIVGASETLAATAARHGLKPASEYTILSGDGRLIRIYRYDVPFMLTNQFVAGTATLGRLISEEHVTRDISDEYNRKLDQYMQLVTRAGAGGYPDESASLLIGELNQMHQTAQNMKSITVYLES